jgi:DNA-binding NarL/FixJ family response regulator
VDVPTSATIAARRGLRVLLADDHQLFREGMRQLLPRNGDIEVLPDASDGQAAVRLAIELSPDVVLMDVAMPHLNGVEATRQIRARCPSVHVIGLSVHLERPFVREMIAAGASGYLPKDCSREELLTAIHAAAVGETYLSPKVTRSIVFDENAGGELRRRYGGLTPRERDVLLRVVVGQSSKEIDVNLGPSVKTVDTHRRQVMEKLQLYTVAELTHFAIREGLTCA